MCVTVCHSLVGVCNMYGQLDMYKYSYMIQYIDTVNTTIQYHIDYMSVQYVDMVLSRCGQYDNVIQY